LVLLPHLLTLLLLLFPMQSHTAEVSLKMPGGRVALADYRPVAAGVEGERGVLLLLHGFLQTHHFGLIQSVADELNSSGWSVLAPTLTLGIDHRRQSLPCDALQLHSLDSGEVEIGEWLDWLKSNGHRQIVLAGHSSGAMRLLHFADRNRDAGFSGLILMSMIHLSNWENPGQGQNERARARHLLSMGRSELAPYSVSYCVGNYMAPPAPFLSYVGFDERRVLAALQGLQNKVSLIYGLADRRLPAGWIERMGAAAPLYRIAEADHFFSGMQEFDLHAVLLKSLNQIVPAPAAVGPD
jgi:pimeloyl-ACP methyl ester carboxylesterase